MTSAGSSGKTAEKESFTVFISVKNNIILVLLLGSFYLYDGRPFIDTPNQCNTFMFIMCICSTDSSGMEKCRCLLVFTPYMFYQFSVNEL